MLPLSLYTPAEWAKELVAHFLATARRAVSAGAQEAAAKLTSVLSDNRRHVGLLISERIINVPMALSEPLTRAVFDEVAWATEDEPTEERRKAFECTDFLMASRYWIEIEGGDGKPEWSKYEDALYDQVATVSWRYPVDSGMSDAKPTLDSSVQEYRQIMLVPASAIPIVRRGLEKVFGRIDGEV